jgi:hypothetical protein
MAGRGPAPKPAAIRQRRNKTTTAATLTAVHAVRPPKLPDRVDDEGSPVEWHAQTLQWWKDIWSSPMAPEFLKSDIHGLFLLAELEDMFHRAPSPSQKIELAKEIRLQRQAYGLSPIDRRRLQWEVDRGDQAVERQTKRKASPKRKKKSDPRDDFLARRQQQLKALPAG